MSGDLAGKIRQRQTEDAHMRLRYPELAEIHASRRDQAVDAVLALCDEADAMPAEQRRQWGAPTTLAIRRVIAEHFGVDHG